MPLGIFSRMVMGGAMAGIEIDQVVKDFGGFVALKGVSISIADGAFVALVGPSGCGKTTLLRAICGLEDVTDGEIRIGGQVVTDLPPKDRDIAMVFQSYALYPHLDVFDNMSFSMRIAKSPRAAMVEKVERAAGILGLAPMLKRLPRQLSGGQRQRVAMGRAIVRSPKVFLFDEPLSNLDAKLRVQMRKEIKQLHQRLKVTSVFVTHDQVEAMTLADRIVVMNGGKVEQTGDPLALYDRPATPFVAGFIGSPAMNLIDAVVDRASGTPRAAVTGGGHLPLPDDVPGKDGQRIVYGVRPEHLVAASPDALRQDAEGLSAEVTVVEPTGFETFVYCDSPAGEICLQTTDRLALKPGAKVRLVPEPTHVHIFDAASGARLN